MAWSIDYAPQQPVLITPGNAAASVAGGAASTRVAVLGGASVQDTVATAASVQATGYAPSVVAQSPAPTTALNIKTLPNGAMIVGVVGGSVNTDGWPTSVTAGNGVKGNGRNATEVSKLVASIAANPNGNIIGYAPVYTWATIAGTTQGAGNAAGVIADAQALWTAAANAGITQTVYFLPQFWAYEVYNGAFSSGAWNSLVPSYVANGGSQYGDVFGPATTRGWVLSQYNGTNNTYGYVAARLDVAGVMQAYMADIVAIGNATITANSGPYAGKTYAFKNHPAVCGFVNTNDVDLNMISNPYTPADYSGANWSAQLAYMAANMGTPLAPTPFACAGGYGATGAQVADQLTLLQNMQAGATGLTSSDVFYTGTGNGLDLTYAQHYDIGNVNTGTNSNPAWSAGGTDYTNVVWQCPNAQGNDYGGSEGKTVTDYTATQVTGMMGVAFNTLGAQVFIAGMDDNRYTGAWTGSNGYGPNGISGVIQQFSIPAAASVVPTAYIPQVQGLFVTGVSPPAFTWTGITGFSLYDVYVATTPFATPTLLAASVTTNAYTDTRSLTAGQTYYYTVVALNNQGAGLTPSAGLPILYAPKVTGLVASNVTTTSFTLSWNAAAGATGYDVVQNGVVVITNLSATQTVITGLTSGATVAMQVAAVEGGGVGAYSTALSVTTLGYFVYSNGVFDYTNFPANNDYSYGITEAYTDTTYTQGGHAYSAKIASTAYGGWQPASNWSNSPYGANLAALTGSPNATHFIFKARAWAANQDLSVYIEYKAPGFGDQVVCAQVNSLVSAFGAMSDTQFTQYSIPMSSISGLGPGAQNHFYKWATHFVVPGTFSYDDVGWTGGYLSLIENGTGSIVSPWVDASGGGATCNYNVVPTNFGSNATQPFSLMGFNNPTGNPSTATVSYAYAVLTGTTAHGYWKATNSLGFNTSPYTNFTFGAQPTKSGYGFVVSAYNTSGTLLGSVTIAHNSPYTLYDVGVSATQWIVYNIPLTALNAAGTTIGAVEIYDNSTNVNNVTSLGAIGFFS